MKIISLIYPRKSGWNHGRSITLIILVALLSLGAVFVPSAEASDETASLLVKMKNGLSPQEQAAVISRNGGTEKSSIPALRLHVVQIPANVLSTALSSYQFDSQVERAEINQTRKSEAMPSDPRYNEQWALPQISWDQVYGSVTTSGTATVAVLDTGIDASHPDLSGVLVPGTSILDLSTGMTDSNGHGTWMAGIIAAVPNTEGIAGVAFSGVRVMPVAVLGEDGTGWDSDIIAGVMYAADHGADVILMGFSNPGFSQGLQDAIDYAWSKNAVLVAATGNDRSGTPTYPAGDRGVVGVSATNAEDILADFSNYGEDAFLAAPGTNILTTNLTGTYTPYTPVTGTSASAAIVAGVAAFMRAVDPSLTNGVIVGRLAGTADPAGSENQTGNGRVNMARAVSSTATESIQPVGIPGGGPILGPYVAGALVLRNVTLGSQNGTLASGTPGSVTFALTVTKVGGSGNAALTVTTPLPAGTSVSFSPDPLVFLDNGNYTETCTLTISTLSSTAASTTTFTLQTAASNAVTATGTLTIVKGTPIITWANPDNITYGTPLGDTQLNASASVSGTPSVPGSFSYTPAGGTVLSAGSGQGLHADFSPAEPNNYNTASADVQINVLKAPATVTLGNLSQTYDGTARNATATTSPEGLNVTFTYNGLSIAPNNAGTYTVIGTINETNYAGSATGTMIIDMVTPSVTTWPTASGITYGQPLSASSLTGGSASVSGSFAFTVPTTAPDAGAYSAAVTFTPTDTTNYNLVSGSVEVAIARANQETLLVIAPGTLTYGTTATLSSSGGSGNGAVSYSAGSSTGCSVSGSTLFVNNASGDCMVTATKAGDANYNEATSSAATVALQKASQATVALIAPAILTYGTTTTLSSSGGSGTGAVSYSVGSSTGCSASGSTLSVTNASGDCMVTATKAGDSNFNEASSSAATVALQKASQATVAIIAPGILTYGTTTTLSSSGGSGTGAMSYSVGSSTGCSVSGSILSVKNASGDCMVTATKAGDSNFNEASSSAATVALQKASQATVALIAPAILTYGTTTTLSSSGGSGTGAVSYSVGFSTGCLVSDSVLSVTNASGDCMVTATKAGDSNFNQASSSASTVMLQKAIPIVTAWPTASGITYGEALSLSTLTGGSPLVPGSFAFTSPSFIPNAGTYSASVSFTPADTTNYNIVYGSVYVVVAKVTPSVTTLPTASQITYGQQLSASTLTGGSASVSGSFAFTVPTTAPDAGAYSAAVTFTPTDTTNYNLVSGSVEVAIARANQETLLVIAPGTLTYGTTATLSSSGGSGNGAVSYSAGSSTGCSVSGSTLSVNNASGDCMVTATKAGDANYNEATSSAATVALQKASQATVVLIAPAILTYGTTTTLSSSGGSGTGAVSYSVGSSTGCSASGSTLSVTNASGDCMVTATKAGDSNFNEASSSAATVALQKASQATVAIIAPGILTYGTTTTLSSSGGSGTGAMSYSVGSSTGCSVSGSILSVTNASGDCMVTATKAGDSNFNEATSSAAAVALQKADQETLLVLAPGILTYGTTTTLSSSGGSGTGAVSYSVGSSTGCSVSGSILSVTNASGDCMVTATKAGDSNYNETSSSPATVSLQKAGPIVTTWPTASGITYLQPLSASTLTGGSASVPGSFAFSTPTMTPTAGTYSAPVNFTPTMEYRTNYTTVSGSVNVAVARADQEVLTINAPPTLAYGSTATLTTMGGSGTGVISYSTGSSTGCSVSGSILSVTDASGTCSITATKAGDVNYNEITSEQATVSLKRSNQQTLTIIAPGTLTYGTTATLSSSGGSGTGAVSYSVGSSTGCSISGSTLSVTNASSTCSVIAMKAADADYTEATSSAATVVLQKANQATLSAIAPGILTYGTTTALTSSGGSGTGAVSYSAGSSTGCSVSGSTLSVNNASGDCMVTATKAGDSNFNEASSSAATVTLQKANQATLLAVAPGILTYGTTATLSSSGGSGTGAVSYSVGSSTGCLVSGSVLSVTNASGTCMATATKAGDSNFNEASSSAATITLQKAEQQTLLVIAPETLTYGNTATLTSSGGSGTGAVSYSAGSSTGCSVSGSILSVTDASGTCSVTATKSVDNNYNAVASSSATITLQKAIPIVTAWPTASGITYGQQLSASTLSGGSASVPGSFAFAAPSTIPNAGVYSAEVTFTPMDTINYNTVIGTVNVTVARADQATLLVIAPGTLTYGSTASLTINGGSGTGVVSYSVGSSTGCSVSGSILSVTNASGTCMVTASKAADSNYNAAASSPATVSLLKADQTALLVISPASVTYGSTATLTSSGGSGMGAVSYSAGSSTGCSVSGSILSVTNAGGTCSITATKAGDPNYNEASSLAATVMLRKANQAALAVIAPGSLTYGTTTALTSSGGSGTGAVSYSAGSSTGCSVSGSTLSVTNASATCMATATKAGDSNYNEASSLPATVTLQKANQETLLVIASATLVYGNTSGLMSSGGSGDGAVTYSAGSSTGCSVSGGILSVTNAGGTCSITATKAGDPNYNEASSSAATVTLQKAEQQTLLVIAPETLTYGNTATLTKSGGSGTGAVSYSAGSSTGCSVSGSILSVTDASGTCTVTATKAGDTNYNTITSPEDTISLQKATPTVTIWPLASGITYGQQLSASTLTSGSGSIPGNFGFTTSATAPNAGIYSAAVTFTPTDMTNYLTVTGYVYVAVARATPTITWNNPADITYGTALAGAELNAAASVPGTLIYTPAAGVVLTAAGNQTLSVNFTPIDTSNYNVASATVRINVLKAAATVTLGNLSRIYDTTARNATGTTDPAGLTIAFTYNGSATPPINAGSYTVVGTIEDTNYQGSTTGTMTIAKATPTVTTWPLAGEITYTQRLSASTLSGGSASAPGSFAFAAPSTMPNAGVYSAAVAFAPMDTINYNTVSGSVDITVSKATPVLTWNNPGDITYGAALGGAQLNATASVPGSFIYTPAAGTVLPAGNSRTLSAEFTPSDTSNYDTVSASATINVLKAIAAVTLDNLGHTYNSTAKNATAATNPAGLTVAFTYDSLPTAPTNAGSYTVVGTIEDENYRGSAAGTMTIAKATPDVTTWPLTSGITYTQQLSASTLSGGSASIPGSFAFTAPSTIPNAGAYSAAVTFTPTDAANYNTVNGNVIVEVARADQAALRVSAPASLAYGNTATLTSSGGSGTGLVSYNVGSSTGCSVSGNVVTIIAATGTCWVTAAKAAESNYNAAISPAVTIVPQKAGQTITFGAVTGKMYGDAPFMDPVSSNSGLAVSLISLTGDVCTAADNTVTIHAAGTCTLEASQGGNTNYNAAPIVKQSFTVAKANQAITFGSLPGKTVGDPDFAPGATASSGLPVSYASSLTQIATIVDGNIHILKPGTTTIIAFQDGDMNYNAAPSVQQSFTVSNIASFIGGGTGGRGRSHWLTWSGDPSRDNTINFYTKLLCPYGDACSYNWNFGDPDSGPANTTTGRTVFHTFSSFGTYKVILSVTDGSRSHMYTTSVFVNTKPLVSHGPITTDLYTISFIDKSLSTDGVALPNNAVTVFWGDGAVSRQNAGTVFTHTYKKARKFNVLHTVTDSGDEQGRRKLRTIERIMVSVPQKFTVEGTVSKRGEGLPHVIVSLTYNGRTRATARTDASGNYIFKNVLPGVYTIKAYKYNTTFSDLPDSITVNAGTILNFTAQ